jgi:hypothetical protein
MAGEVLSKQQRTLWKRAEQRGGLNSMTDSELVEWIAACRLLIDYADRGPKKAAKARWMWADRLADAQDALAQRHGSD